MRREAFRATPDAEARILLLIATFSQGNSVMEGRTKLAKLDFFLRYPSYLRRAIGIRAQELKQKTPDIVVPQENIESRMVRYRYGPWDPQYYSVLGRLIGKGLVVTVPVTGGIGYKATDLGSQIAKRLSETDPWEETSDAAKLLKKFLNLTGSNLKEFVYDNFPEVAGASWGRQL